MRPANERGAHRVATRVSPAQKTLSARQAAPASCPQGTAHTSECDWCGEQTDAGTEFLIAAFVMTIPTGGNDVVVASPQSWWLSCPSCAGLIRRRKSRRLLDRGCLRWTDAAPSLIGQIRSELAVFFGLAERHRTGAEQPWPGSTVAG